jgi:toxin ParE1/3/4
MSRAIIKLPQAEADLIGCYAYLGENATIETADRFLDAAERTLAILAKSPGIGTAHNTAKGELGGIRSLPISKFKKYVLFYYSFEDRIELVRVLHGSRNIRRILGE